MKKFLVLILIVPLFAACASSPSPPSLAMQIAEAGNIHKDLRDLPADEFGEHIVESRREDPGTSTVALTAGYSAKVFTPPPGVSAGGATAISALALLAGTSSPASFLQILAWMPEELASNKESAREQMAQLFEQAVREAVPPDFSIETEDSQEKALIGVIFNRRDLRIRGGICEQHDCYIKARLLTSGGKPKLESTPDFLGGGRTWVWRYTSTGAIGDFVFSKAENQPYPFDMTTFYRNLSMNLPPWAFVYVPPQSNISIIPVIYSQGEAHNFVTPEG